MTYKIEESRFQSDVDTFSCYQITFPLCSLSSTSVCSSLLIIPRSKQMHNSISRIVHTPTPWTSLALQNLAPAHRLVSSQFGQ